MGRSVAAIVKDIGFGVSQLLTGIVVNGAWLADGAEALAISAVSAALVKDFHIDDVQSGTLTSVVYLGALIGTLFSGILGDIVGRRLPILLSYPVIVFFSLLSAASQNFCVMLALRLFVGFGFGLGQPNAIALLVEVTPPRWRIVNTGLAQVAFALGELFCCLVLWLDDPTMTNVSWPLVLRWNALPAGMFFFLSMAFLTESPEFLALSSPSLAQASLESMALQNGQQVSCDIDCEGEGWSSFDARGRPRKFKTVTEQLTIVFGPKMLWTTLGLGWIYFCYNLVNYGCFFAFPQVLPHMHLGTTPVAALAVGALWEIPCDFFGVLCGMYMPRKHALSIYFVGQIISAGLFMYGNGSSSSAFLLAGYFGLKGFPQIGSVVLFVYAAESYPVEARATGTAVVLGVGRLGAILSSVVYGAIWEAYGTSQPFFQLSIALTMMSMAATACLPESRPRLGEEIGDEGEPIARKT